MLNINFNKKVAIAFWEGEGMINWDKGAMFLHCLGAQRV